MKPAASTRLTSSRLTSSRLTSSGLFVAALLVVFSVSGLMAGMVTRQITTVAVSSGVPATATLSSAAQTATAAANGTPTASGAFALKVQLVPNTARIGQTVQLTVMACTLDCGPNTMPLPGVLCTLQQTPSAPSLSGAWPSPLLTDSGGQARWNLALASQMAPGAYQISVRGDGAAYNGKAYSWSGTWTLVVTA